MVCIFILLSRRYKRVTFTFCIIQKRHSRSQHLLKISLIIQFITTFFFAACYSILHQASWWVFFFAFTLCLYLFLMWLLYYVTIIFILLFLVNIINLKSDIFFIISLSHCSIFISVWMQLQYMCYKHSVLYDSNCPWPHTSYSRVVEPGTNYLIL